MCRDGCAFVGVGTEVARLAAPVGVLELTGVGGVNGSRVEAPFTVAEAGDGVEDVGAHLVVGLETGVAGVAGDCATTGGVCCCCGGSLAGELSDGRRAANRLVI